MPGSGVQPGEPDGTPSLRQQRQVPLQHNFAQFKCFLSTTWSLDFPWPVGGALGQTTLIGPWVKHLAKRP
jgi:hypothetical protein